MGGRPPVIFLACGLGGLGILRLRNQAVIHGGGLWTFLKEMIKYWGLGISLVFLGWKLLPAVSKQKTGQ